MLTHPGAEGELPDRREEPARGAQWLIDRTAVELRQAIDELLAGLFIERG